MQGFYEHTQDFTATFRQDYAYKTFGRTATSTGTVAFKKPGLMRWDYLTPSQRSFVLSGERAYAWDPAAQTLTRAAAPTSELSTPKKPETRFRELRLELDPKTAQVRKTVVVDPDGSENAIVFTDLRTNTGLSKGTFVLDVPNGTQVLDVGAPPHP